MNSLLRLASPTLTNLIRMDHTAVMLAFHRYKIDAPVAQKKAVAESICLALEIHAQLENEILYPATRPLVSDGVMDESILPQTDEVLRRIGVLRPLQPGSAEYDLAFMELMREVMHHVADEETTLLPAADQQLAGQLEELGAQFSKRRLELTAPVGRQLTRNLGAMFPARTYWWAAGAALGTLWAMRRLRRRR